MEDKTIKLHVMISKVYLHNLMYVKTYVHILIASFAQYFPIKGSSREHVAIDSDTNRLTAVSAVD